MAFARKTMKRPVSRRYGERAADAIAVLQEARDRALHEDVDLRVADALVLERADHLEPRAVADVREARVLMAAEVPLQDAAVGRAVEERAPRLELLHAIRRLERQELGHAPVVQHLPAAHRVAEVDLPAVAVVGVGERRRHAALGHDGVGLPEERLADEGHAHALRRRLDGRAEPGAAGADDQDVVGMRLEAVHRRRPATGAAGP
jgi:hypothetical protein